MTIRAEMPLCRRIAFATALSIAVLATQVVPMAGASPACSLYASPSGSDASNGSLTTPFQTVQHLAGSLSSGQVGCLREGSYAGASASGASFQQLKITRPGITLTSAPGEKARINGRVWIAQGADGVTMENLSLDGVNSNGAPSPTVDANGSVFNHVEVTNDHTAICFALGNFGYEVARRTVIENSRIHDCGIASTNQQHGIYISAGYNTIIRDNWIYDNASRGIQLYPDAQGTTITGNVIYGNGEGVIFSGNESTAASNTTVTNNVIAGSTIRRNVESYYEPGAATGVNNVVSDNCIYGGSSAYYRGPEGSGLQQPEVGFRATDNLATNPQFVDAANGDFRLVAGSACASAQAPLSYDELPGVVSTMPEAPRPEPAPEAPHPTTSPASEQPVGTPAPESTSVVTEIPTTIEATATKGCSPRQSHYHQVHIRRLLRHRSWRHVESRHAYASACVGGNRAAGPSA